MFFGALPELQAFFNVREFYKDESAYLEILGSLSSKESQRALKCKIFQVAMLDFFITCQKTL